MVSLLQCAMAHHAMPATVKGVDIPKSQSLDRLEGLNSPSPITETIMA